MKTAVSGEKQKKFDFVSVFILCVPYLITAAISAMIGIMMFRVKEIAPYGERSVLCLDLWGQYFPMYVNNKLTEKFSDFFYSWNGAFGFNNWAQSAYYCNSIFLLLFKLLPVKSLVKALDIFCLLKMVFSSMTCLGFLHYRTKKKSPVLIAGAVCYSVCSYMLAYLSQFMWTDCLIYAPLMLIGIERLVHEKKPVFYTLILALSIVSSFYIGFAMCIFSVLYFISSSIRLIQFSKLKPYISGGKAFGLSILRFSIFSIAAGALSALTVIPVGYAISNTLAAENPAPEKWEWYGNITSVLQDFLPNQQLFQEYKGANLFTGLIIFLGIPLYFANKHIRLTERIADGAVFCFLLASLNCNFLNYFWHGLHFPNQLPGRWSFLLSLYAVLLTCRGLLEAQNMTFSEVFRSCAAGAAIFYVTVAGVGTTEAYDKLPSSAWKELLIVSVALLAGSLVVRFMKDEKKDGFFRKYIFNKNALLYGLSVLTAIVMVTDSGKSFITSSQYEGMQGLATSMEESYTNAMEKSIRYGQKWKSGNSDFYRVDANNGYTFNNSMLGDYHGMRYYSSTMNGKVFQFLQFMGNRVYADKVSTVYSLGSPVQNSLFGIRYFMDFDRSLNNVVPGMTMLEEGEEGNFYENPRTLSLAYPVSKEILSYQMTDQIRGITNQNALVNSMCGEEINPYRRIDCQEFTFENVYFQENEDWNQNFFINDTGEPSRFHYRYQIETDGFYFMEHNYRAGSVHIQYGDRERTIHPGDGRFAYLGDFKAGDTILLDVEIENVGLGCFGLELYRLDEEAWDYAYQKLSAHQLQVTEFQNTKITGTISLDEPSLIFASIPQDGGWEVFCDGQKIPPQTAAGIMLCCAVPSGQHEIIFRYHVKGLFPGMILSLISAAGILLYVFRKYIFRKKEKNPLETQTEHKT